MNREYHRWYTPRLGRDMELLVFGHGGAKVLVFPTRDGRFHEYEDLRLVEALRPKIDAGQLQLWCVVRIPGQGGHRFHGKTDMDSTPRRPALPREGGR
jgi:esterase/lipase superfamily enzyme